MITWKEYAERLEMIISSTQLPAMTRTLVDGLVKMAKEQVTNEPLYVMVPWPEYQHFMDSPRWNECLLTDDNAYMIPEDLYNEQIEKLTSPEEQESRRTSTE